MREFDKRETPNDYWQPGDGSPYPEISLPRVIEDILNGSKPLLLTYREALQRFLIKSFSNFYSGKRADPAIRFGSPDYGKFFRDLFDLDSQRFEG